MLFLIEKLGYITNIVVAICAVVEFARTWYSTSTVVQLRKKGYYRYPLKAVQYHLHTVPGSSFQKSSCDVTKDPVVFLVLRLCRCRRLGGAIDTCHAHLSLMLVQSTW
jgi:hypothetical protein